MSCQVYVSGTFLEPIKAMLLEDLSENAKF